MNFQPLIKGISKGLNRTKVEWEYMDASKILQPGETTTIPSINKEYDDYSDLDRYIGEIGSVKSGNEKNGGEELTTNEVLESSKRINAFTLEIISRSNITDVICKKGDKITLKATGNILLGAFAGSTTPDGINGYTNYNREVGFFPRIIIRENRKWEMVPGRQVCGNRCTRTGAPAIKSE